MLYQVFKLFLFIKIVIANQKVPVDKATGSIYAGNCWQLEFDSRRNKPGRLHTKLLLFHREEEEDVTDSVHLRGVL